MAVYVTLWLYKAMFLFVRNIHQSIPVVAIAMQSVLNGWKFCQETARSGQWPWETASAKECCLTQGSVPCPRQSTSNSSFLQRQGPRPLTQLRTMLLGHPNCRTLYRVSWGFHRDPITLLAPLPKPASFPPFPSLRKVRISTAFPNKLPVS